MFQETSQSSWVPDISPIRYPPSSMLHKVGVKGLGVSSMELQGHQKFELFFLGSVLL